MCMPRYTSAKLPLPMWCRRLNLPMICPSPEAAAAAEEDGDAPDRRGFDGVAMFAALAEQPSLAFLVYVYRPSIQLPTGMRVRYDGGRGAHGPQSVAEGLSGRGLGTMRWRACWGYR
jgi:hypothetical protein